MFTTQSIRWLQQAQTLLPQLTERLFSPTSLVEPCADSDAFQGWRLQQIAPAAELVNRWMSGGDSVVLDFGEHLVGHLAFSVHLSGTQNAPVRLQFIFGETPAEVAEPFDPYRGNLSRAWLQDEVINLDELPHAMQLPRRYAFRYLRIVRADTEDDFLIQLRDISCHALTAASFELPVQPTPAAFADIDRVSLRTLRNCMQTVFEDGPKRDRRLWLGDLRLMAQTNYLTFRNFALVKRCLYLFAGTAGEDGMVAGSVYERPRPLYGNSLLTFACLFAPTLLDYAQASGDWELARELWPVARRQIDFALQYVQSDQLFIDPGTWWIFFDWCEALDNQASMHACIIYSLRALVVLADNLGLPQEVAALQARIVQLVDAARTLLWDEEQGFFISGVQRQCSWSSQVWMVLAGVLTPAEAAPLLQRMLAQPDLVRPNGPYLYHHVMEALLSVGLVSEAQALLQEYWGGMLARGATTFWEVFNPADDRLSPYANHLVNSYCHAWSSTPSYLMRKYPALIK
ncbi:MAG TPA: sugar hydrolase [Armatimonadota bacterium]